jgi:hypothetical protein
VPERRVAQVLLETDKLATAPERRVSQVVLEVDKLASAPQRRVSQVLLEVDLDQEAVPIVVRQVGQVLLEVDFETLRTPQVDQVLLEVDFEAILSPQVTQAGAEMESAAAASRRVTLTGAEIESAAAASRWVTLTGTEVEIQDRRQRQASFLGLEVEIEPAAKEPLFAALRAVPTHQTSALLVAHIWKPEVGPPYKPRGRYLGTVPLIESYEHTLSADGGFTSASFSFRCSLSDVDEWLDDGLGRHVEIYDDALQLVWEGFVNQVRATAAGLAVSRGPLADIANRVVVAYREVELLGINPPGMSDEVSLTPPLDNVESQARYGIIGKVVQANQVTADEALNLAAHYLQQYAFPATAKELSLGDRGQELSLTVECLGYYHWLSFYYYSFTEALPQTRPASEKLALILDADPNGIFSSANAEIEENTLEVQAYEEYGRTAKELVQKILELGGPGPDYARYLLRVGPGRRVYYYRQPLDIVYRQYLSDPLQRVQTIAGLEVRPWAVQPAVWLQIPDLLVGRVRPGTALERDPRVLFVESVTYSAPYNLRVSSSPPNAVARIFAQQARSSMNL